VSALLDVRAAAADRAAARTGDSGLEHWTACERGCGAPAGATLVRATAAGPLTIDVPGAPEPAVAADVPAALRRLAGPTPPAEGRP
jgi:hypothetical protein